MSEDAKIIADQYPNSEQYNSGLYMDKDRWVSYFWQTKLVKDLLKSGKILEIGVGSSVVTDYFRKNYDLLTVDINKELNPDYTCSVEDLSVFPDNSFDLAVCAEVLEHLPFEKFEASILELKRVSKKYIIVSLPYWGYTFGLKLKLPLLGKRVLKFKISGTKKHLFNGQHYWEIGKKGFPGRRIIEKFTTCGLKMKKSFWDIDDPYHYYFILEK
jgi:predicted SAM-dependent methyltransferase